MFLYGQLVINKNLSTTMNFISIKTWAKSTYRLDLLWVIQYFNINDFIYQRCDDWLIDKIINISRQQFLVFVTSLNLEAIIINRIITYLTRLVYLLILLKVKIIRGSFLGTLQAPLNHVVVWLFTHIKLLWPGLRSLKV